MCGHLLIFTASLIAFTGCSTPTIQTKNQLENTTAQTNTTVQTKNQLENTTEGFYVFHGRCLNSETPKFAPALIPLLTNLVSSGIKLAGTTLKTYGADSDAKFAATVNFDGDGALNECLHIVSGKVYTNKIDFQNSTQQLNQVLPLPWESIARANLADNATSKEVADQTQSSMDAAKSALASSGAMVAEKPNLFAELRILRSKDESSISFRLRAFYYGAPLTDSWFKRSNAKAIIISLSSFDPSKPLIDNLKNGYSIPLYKVPVKSTWVTGDLLYPTISASQTWDTPYFPITSLGKKPLTVVVGLLETTAGSKLLTTLGTALESTSDTTATGIVDKFDTQKLATNKAKEKSDDDKARTASATAATQAITDLGKANDAYDTCVTLLSVPSPTGTLTKVQRDAVLAYASARVVAAASFAAAEPTISALKLNTNKIADPGMCVMQ